MPVLGQHKFKYTVTITFPDGTFSSAVVDDFTPPAKKNDIITRQNPKYGQITLRGPTSYSEGMMRIALRVNQESGGTAENAGLLTNLVNIGDSDADTINLSLVLDNLLSGQSDPEASYQQDFLNCKVSSIKVDPVNYKQDDDFVYVEFSFTPSKMTKLYGPQLGTSVSG